MSSVKNRVLEWVLFGVILVHFLQIAPMALAKMIPKKPMQSSSNSSETKSRFFTLPPLIDDFDIMQAYSRLTTAIMNQSINPCENFYEYACGNWKHSELIPEKHRNVTAVRALQSELDALFTRIIKNGTKEDLKVNTAESKAKIFYGTCMKMRNEMERGYKQLLELKEFTKELAPASKNEQRNWITINFLSSYGVYPLLPLQINFDQESRKYYMQVSSPEILLSDSSLVDIKNLTRDFKIENDTLQKNFISQFENMVSFEKNLTFYASPRKVIEKTNLQEFLMKHKVDALNWTLYFHIAFNGSEEDDWTVYNTIEDVDPLAGFLHKTDLKTLQDYVKWCTIVKFHYLWKFAVEEKSAESICGQYTEHYFKNIFISWFIENLFDADRRADILNVAKLVKETFYNLIGKHSWIDDKTKSNALTKLTAMDVHVGYTDRMRHQDVIDKDYRSVHITEDWFKNVLVMEANRAKVRMSLVNKQAIDPLLTRNAAANHDRFLNTVYISLGLAQFPFYHIKFPASLKFGGVGYFAGHEMSHGFDSRSYRYNYDGRNQTWWTKGSLQNVTERYRCVESQYNKYIFHGVATNGSFTLPDNIADNVGLRLAYIAYMNSHDGKQKGNQKPIPGLNFTNRQLFFLRFAQSWCNGLDDVHKMKKVKLNNHAIEEFRVIGTLSNMPEFSEVFKCKLGSDMNPLKKCVVW